MKNYIKPSALMSKFDIEDVIMASGQWNAVNTLNNSGVAATAVYQEYLNDSNNSANAANAFIEFQW